MKLIPVSYLFFFIQRSKKEEYNNGDYDGHIAARDNFILTFPSTL